MQTFQKLLNIFLSLLYFFAIPTYFFAACADCVTELSPWSECIDGLKTQIEIVVSAAVGTGKACPEVLASNEEGYLFTL